MMGIMVQLRRYTKKGKSFAFVHGVTVHKPLDDRSNEEGRNNARK
jgi:hypothetical protein